MKKTVSCLLLALPLMGQSVGTKTTTSYINVPVAVCTDDSTASATVNLPTTNPPEAACVSTTTNNQLHGTLAFDQSTDESFQFLFRLPPGFTGAIGIDILWHSTATSGSVAWATQTSCVGPSENEDAAFNTQDSLTASSVDGTASDWVVASDANVTATGCGPNELLTLKVFRDTSEDDLTADALMKEFRLSVVSED